MIAIVSSIAALLHQCIADAMRAVHLSAPFAPVSNRTGCNRGATTVVPRLQCTSWRCSALLFVAVSLGGAPRALAQQEPGAPSSGESRGHRGASIVTFVGGAVA